MSKTVKKKSRKMWRTMRKTLGTLFLVSALVIAAIPVDGLRAANSADSGISVAQEGYATDNESYTCRTSEMIPQMDKDTKIYTTAGQEIQFAYLNDGSGYGAVIVGYNGGYLENGTLDFTKPVDAYGQYRINDGTGGYSFVAVGLKGNFLFYEEQIQQTYTGNISNPVDVAGIMAKTVVTEDSRQEVVSRVVKEVEGTRRTEDIKNDDGVVTGQAVTSLTVIERTGRYLPCYTDTYATWSVLPDTALWYDDNDRNGGNPNSPVAQRLYKEVGENSDYQRIKNATITYISNQFITTDSKGKWSYVEDSIVDDDHSDKGIFANENNVKNLIVSVYFK